MASATPLTERERREVETERHRWKFDGTLTFGNILMVLTFLFGAIGLYVQSAEKDVRQDAELERLAGQIDGLIFTTQQLGTAIVRLSVVETQLTAIERDLNWIIRRLDGGLQSDGP